MITLFGFCLVLAVAQPEPTAEELLRTLREKRPNNPVIASAMLPREDKSTLDSRLYPEGYAIVEQSGVLTRDGDWWAFEPDPANRGDSPIRLLANQQLEVMKLTAHAAQGQAKFMVSGEMTVFENQNYLLIHRAVLERSSPSETRTPNQPKPPAAAPEKKKPGSNEQSIERVIESIRLLRPPVESLAPQVLSSPTDPSNDGASFNPSVLPEGTVVVRRPGRIVRRRNSWFFVFESDHSDYPEPPIVLHPNQTVELMIKTSEQGAKGLVFLVTGDVTLFQNRNYLLPRVAIRRIDSGNLTK